MLNFRTAIVRAFMLAVLSAVLMPSFGATARPQSSGDEQTLWNLERSYREDVRDNNLTAYMALWHKDFLGWPSVSPAPVRKDHITDWITVPTSKGRTFKLVEFKPATIQISGDIAVPCYWVSFEWRDKDGKGPSSTLRVTHTWLKEGTDWRIIGGMSMQEPKS